MLRKDGDRVNRPATAAADRERRVARKGVSYVRWQDHTTRPDRLPEIPPFCPTWAAIPLKRCCSEARRDRFPLLLPMQRSLSRSAACEVLARDSPRLPANQSPHKIPAWQPQADLRPRYIHLWESTRPPHPFSPKTVRPDGRETLRFLHLVCGRAKSPRLISSPSALLTPPTLIKRLPWGFANLSEASIEAEPGRKAGTDRSITVVHNRS